MFSLHVTSCILQAVLEQEVERQENEEARACLLALRAQSRASSPLAGSPGARDGDSMVRCAAPAWTGAPETLVVLVDLLLNKKSLKI